MTDFSNGLSPAEAERLALLAEECGEVVQAVGKALRHGYESSNPLLNSNDRTSRGRTNRAELAREVGQLLHVVEMLLESGDLPRTTVSMAQVAKREAIGSWLHHA